MFESRSGKLKIITAVLLLSGSFLFLGSVKNASAYLNSYSKLYNGTLTAAEWNNLASDFLNKSGGATMTGPLGIGTSTPASGLWVNGPIYATNFSGGAFTGFIDASNVMGGSGSSFGSNSGGGNYSFPSNLGIGTTNPGAKLDVAGTGQVIRIAPTAAADSYFTVLNNLGANRVTFGWKQSNDTGFLGNNANTFMEWTQVANPAIKFTSTGFTSFNGSVGIGTTNPQASLDTTGLIKMRTATITQSEDVINKGYLDSALASTSATIITQLSTSSLWNGSLAGNIWSMNTGNVGLGITNPGSKLSIAGADNKDTGPIIDLAGTSANQVESGRIRFTEVDMQASPYYQGGFIHFNGSANTLNIGVHNNADSLTASDLNSISIARPTGAVSIGNTALNVLYDGNVGVGTTTPSQKLEVLGSIQMSNGSFLKGRRNTGNLSTDLIGYPAGSDTITIGENSGTPAEVRILIPTDAGNYASFYSGANPVAAFTQGGNVGIGTTAPNDTFSIGNSGAAPAGSPKTGHNYTSTYLATDDYALANYGLVKTLIGNATTTLIANSLWNGALNGNIYNGTAGTGNVGIGTTNPLSKFQVRAGADQNFRLGAGTTLEVQAVNDADTLYVPMTLRASKFDFENGNVGIGTTNPGEKLEVAGTISSIVSSVPAKFISSGNSSYPRAIYTVGAAGTSISNFGQSIQPGYDAGGAGSSGAFYLNSRPSGPSGSYQMGFYLDIPNTVSRFASWGNDNFNIRGLPIVFSTALPSTNVTTYDALRLNTDNSAIFYGNVGVGTTAPNDSFSIGNAGTAPAGSAKTGHNFTSTYLATDDYALANYGLVKTLIGNATSTLVANSLWNGTLNGNIYNGTAGAGNVGIGTNNPTLGKLQVVGSATFIPVTGSQLTIDASSASTPRIQSYNSQPLYINELGNNIILNSTSGSVGIGTTNPSGKLQVNGALYLGTSNNNYMQQNGLVTENYGYSGFTFKTWNAGWGAGTTALTIDANGNVGLGATAPNDIFSIGNSGSAPAGSSKTGHNFTSTYLATDDYALANYGLVKTLIGNATSSLVAGNLWNGALNGNIYNGTNGSGNVGIGTTNPGAKLQINNNATVGTPSSGLSASSPILYLDNGGVADGSIVIKSHAVGNGNSIGGIKIASSPDGANYSWAGMRGIVSSGGNAGILAFYTSASNISGDSSTERVRINELGNVGIGTTNPAAKLDINGNIQIPTSSQITMGTAWNTGSFIWYNGGSIMGTMAASALTWTGFKAGGGNPPWTPGYGFENAAGTGMGNIGTNMLAFYTSNAEQVRINNNGNVGIGTTAPNDTLSIGNAGAAPAGSSKTGHNFTSTYLATDDYALTNYGLVKTLIGNATSSLVAGNLWNGTLNGNIYNGVAGAGNVGIGTTTPTAKLEIKGGAAPWSAIKLSSSDGVAGAVYGGQASSLYGYIGSGYYYNSSLWRTQNTAASNVIFNNDGSMSFNTNSGLTANTDYTPTERMRIKADGNVGIGTNNPDVKFHIETSAYGDLVRIKNTANANNNYTIETESTGTDYGLGFKNSAGSTILNLSAGQNVGIRTNDPQYPLAINATAANTFQFNIGGGNGFGLGFDGGGQERFIMGSSYGNAATMMSFVLGGLTTASDKMTILGSGNVGIGTTAPNDIFSIGNAGSAPAGSSKTGHNFTSTYLATDDYALANYGLVKTLIGNATSSLVAGSLWNGTLNGNIWNGASGAGNIGIGTTNPFTKLEIAGALKIGDTADACDANHAGAIRYNPTSDQTYLCDGTRWINQNNCGLMSDDAGQTYGTIQIGGQCWMAENINIGTMLASGATNPTTTDNNIEKWCYSNSPAQCAANGGLYNWDEAMRGSQVSGARGICPSGWHIPSDAEYNKLEKTILGVIASPNAQYACNLTGTGWQRCADNSGTDTGGTYGVGKSLKPVGAGSGVGAGNDLVGFNGKLTGLRYTDSNYYDIGAQLYLWSSTPNGASNAYRRYIYAPNSTIYRDGYPRGFGLSVRCVRD
jgi:uncharacterized protein (TIGR02145 family)